MKKQQTVKQMPVAIPAHFLYKFRVLKALRWVELSACPRKKFFQALGKEINICLSIKSRVR